MEYKKKWLSFNQQAAKLKERGLVFDEHKLISCLSSVGYYRLSGYWYIFKRNPGTEDESFIDGTSFDRVWDLYLFDRDFRLIVLDAIERVEVYIRSQLAYRLGEISGPFGFFNRSTLPNLDQSQYGRFISRCLVSYDRSKTLFIEHFKDKYGDCHGLPPYWTLVNIMDFGMTLTLFEGSPNAIKKEIAHDMGIPSDVLNSWLLTLNTIRNICAHHDRLWNRRLAYRVKIPRGRKYPDWHKPHEVNNRSSFTVITILGYLISRIDPDSTWHTRTIKLIQTRNEDDLFRMGFTNNWKDCPLWVRWLRSS
ncbi:MAG: Abi family protein [Atopobiaceae bacterium]|nr:Abi family protein [Atopobiaceae bacterium]